MSDDRTLDPAGIISEIVEIVADGDVDPLTRCSRYDPRICEGSLGTMQGYGALCAAHVAGLKTAPERIAAIRSWLTDHEDDTCLAEVSDDCVREYKPKYPRGTEDEVRRIAVGDMRVEKLDQLSRIVAAIAPQDEGELIPGLPAAFGQQNDLNAKLNRLKTLVLLRSAPKLREPTSNQRDAIAAELSDWQTMSESERTARIAKLLDDVKTRDNGAWDPYVEARAYLIRDADRNSAFRALLCLSWGLNPGTGVPDEWIADIMIEERQRAACMSGLDRHPEEHVCIVDRAEHDDDLYRCPHDSSVQPIRVSPQDRELMTQWGDHRKSPEIGRTLKISGKRVLNRLSELRTSLCEKCVPNRSPDRKHAKI